MADHMRYPTWSLVLALSILCSPVLGADETLTPGLLASTSSAAAIEEPVPALRVVVDWSEVETGGGRFDWSAVDRAVDAAGTRDGAVLCLTGSSPAYLEPGKAPSPLVAGSIEAWTRFVRSAVRRFADRVGVFEVWDDAVALDPEVYAFLLKQTALAIRAEAEAVGVEVRIAQGAVDFASVAWQRQLWDLDAAAYVDVLPLVFRIDDETAGLEAGLGTWFAEALEHPPAAEVWAYLEPAAGARPWAPFEALIRALGAGATRALARVSEADPEGAALAARWVRGLDALLREGFEPAPMGRIEVGGGRALARFLDDEFNTLVFYRSSLAPGEQVRVLVDGARVQDVRAIDPATGETPRTSAARQQDGRWAIRAQAADYPLAVRFRNAVVTPGFELPTEELEVESTRGLTAGEIIARNQQVQRVQDDALERWVAKGRIDYHFKLAQGGSTVDVSIDSNYFWERGGQLEWEQTAYYINGNKVRWKNVPELPLIQPEKVVTLPLDLTLDKTYVYRLVGEDRVRDREAYVLEFRPVDPEDSSRNLYQGRVWIDRENFQRLKTSLVQTRTGTPAVLSNEERDLYGPQQGPAGRSYWLLSDIEGQQVWSAAGRNFVVRREVTFSEFRINPPAEEFASRRSAAYASNNQMLRDTDDGFRYLEREKDGGRKLKMEMDTSQLFVAAGAFQLSGKDRNVVPLAGANYFNYDLFGRNIQFNALLAGAVNFATASKPDLFGRKISGTVEATAVAIRFDDELFVGGDESDFETVRQRPQNFSARLGIPLGSFFKLSLVGDLTWRDYSLADDSERDLERFNQATGELLEYRLPKDHLETGAAVELEFNRRGYTLALQGEYRSRSDWEAFGLFDAAAGSFVRFTGGDPLDPASYVAVPEPVVKDSFARWRATLFKEWYLRSFQKLRTEVNYLDGADLDRFSQYEFSLFGDDRLFGFAGSGVRFDQGLVGRLGYSFNLFEAIQFDAAVQSARVRDKSDLNEDQMFSGAGVSATFVGPWKTVFNMSYGYALQSDIPDLEGDSEFLLLIFKLFK